MSAGAIIDRQLDAWERAPVLLDAYRPVGDFGDPYPDWFRELDHVAGLYAIRIQGNRRPSWVGESTGGRPYTNPKTGRPSRPNLRKTIARHLQQWDREARGPKGARYAGEYERLDAYDRAAVSVAVLAMPPETRNHPLSMDQRRRIWRLEDRLICELKPEDNQHHAQCTTDTDVPF